MSSTTTNLGLVKMASGETIGQWSDANNGSGANLDKIDTAIGNLNSQIDYTRLLTSADDLDTVSNGTYYFNGGSVPAHSPASNNSIVETYGGGQKFQTVTTASSGAVLVYKRRYYQGWGSWYLFTGTVVT